MAELEHAPVQAQEAEGGRRAFHTFAAFAAGSAALAGFYAGVSQSESSVPTEQLLVGTVKGVVAAVLVYGGARLAGVIK